MTSMVRAFTLPLVTVLLLAPSSALADPLLSGYGGPGGGEQVVLGATFSGGSGGGSGGSSGSGSTDSIRAAPAPTAPGGAASSPAAQAPSSAARTGKRSGAKRSGSAHRRTRPATSAPAAERAPAAVATGAPPVRAYPSRASDAGGLPLSGGDVLIAALALFALILVGSGLRRLSGTVNDDPATAQAAPR
jgi:hypothetical protein